MAIQTLEEGVNKVRMSEGFLRRLKEIAANDPGSPYASIPENYERYFTRCLCGKLLIRGDKRNKRTDYGENCSSEHVQFYNDD